MEKISTPFRNHSRFRRNKPNYRFVENRGKIENSFEKFDLEYCQSLEWNNNNNNNNNKKRERKRNRFSRAIVVH